MVYEGILEGRFVNLRPVTKEDAEFILGIRNNPEISKYLPSLNVTVDQQQSWIDKQRNDINSYYFIIEDKTKMRIGTISVYNIIENHAEVGRFCSFGNSIQNSEAALMLDNFIFQKLGVDYLDIWVYKDNKPVLALNKGLGCVWEGESEDKGGFPYLYGTLTKEGFEKKSQKIRTNLSKIKDIIWEI